MKKLVIDAGHSEAPKSFSREDEIDLIISNKLQRLILDETKRGNERDIVSVVIPYKNAAGHVLDLMDKVRFANIIEADAFLSIHCNWSDNNKVAHGFNIYYDDKPTPLAKESKRFAEIASGQLKKVGFTAWGLDIDIDTHTGPGNLAVCSYTKMPAILIEAGFLSNAGDASALETFAIQDKFAMALYRAVQNFFI